MKDSNPLLATVVIVILILLIGTLSYGPRPPQPQQILDAQLAGWNAGDLEGFMATYLQSAEATFFSGGTAVRGWAEILERYRDQAGGPPTGKLAFSQVALTRLSGEYVLAKGHWSLEGSTSPAREGLFTLILRDDPRRGWKIVHDHTSVSAAVDVAQPQ